MNFTYNDQFEQLFCWEDEHFFINKFPKSFLAKKIEEILNILNNN